MHVDFVFTVMKWRGVAYGCHVYFIFHTAQYLFANIENSVLFIYNAIWTDALLCWIYEPTNRLHCHNNVRHIWMGIIKTFCSMDFSWFEMPVFSRIIVRLRLRRANISYARIMERSYYVWLDSKANKTNNINNKQRKCFKIKKMINTNSLRKAKFVDCIIYQWVNLKEKHDTRFLSPQSEFNFSMVNKISLNTILWYHNIWVPDLLGIYSGSESGTYLLLQPT